METLAIITALLAAVLNGVAGAWGSWRWWTVEPSDTFWRLVRIGTGRVGAAGALRGRAYPTGSRPDDGLFWLYAALPTAIGFFAEQFRILSAQTVLEARGCPTPRRSAGCRPTSSDRWSCRSCGARWAS
jgi:hypothetical protein